MAGCASTTGPTGTVTGTYIESGGPSGRLSPLPGTISFRGQDGPAVSLISDSKGGFTGVLPSGTYVVTATSSLIGYGKSPCSTPVTAHVRAGETVTLTLVCNIR